MSIGFSISNIEITICITINGVRAKFFYQGYLYNEKIFWVLESDWKQLWIDKNANYVQILPISALFGGTSCLHKPIPFLLLMQIPFYQW